MKKSISTLFLISILLLSCKGPNSETVEQKEVNQQGVHTDNYACNINDEGYCIFTGEPHNIDLKTDNAIVSDKDGNRLKVQGKPFQDGYKLISSEQTVTDENELGYIKSFKIMAPIRDAIMYNIADLSSESWNNLTKELTDLQIKVSSENLGSKDRKSIIYSTDDIYTLSKTPENKDIHNEVMKYLEESELELKCHLTKTDLTNPEGVDPCKEIRG